MRLRWDTFRRNHAICHCVVDGRCAVIAGSSASYYKPQLESGDPTLPWPSNGEYLETQWRCAGFESIYVQRHFAGGRRNIVSGHMVGRENP